MSPPVRIGVLGCARIARKSVLPVLRSSTQGALRAVASRRPGVAAEWASEFGAARACESYAELLEDPEVDAVYIPATGEEHASLTIAAARAGKHVLCEKPLATSVAEAREMVAACREAGVILQEAFMWRHHPRTSRTLELIREGAIGPLRLINVSFSFPLNRADWRTRPERGGGVTWDLGCYGVNASRLFTGAEPCEVYARGHYGPSGVDLTMQIAIRFPGNVLANIDCSFEAPWRCRLELVGESGRIEWPTAFQHWTPTILLDTRSDWTIPPEAIACESVNQYARQLEDFCESVRAGRLLTPAEDGLMNTQVVVRALESAATGRLS
jgi:predicted dehydrogenase